MKKGVVVLLGWFCLLWNIFADETKKSVIDMAGSTVELPAHINKIADGLSKHNAIVALVGGGNRIVASSLSSDEKPWLFKVNPGMSRSVKAFSINSSNDINFEELLNVAPDIVFINKGDKNIGKLQEMKLPVIQIVLNDFPSIKKCVAFTGVLMGEEGEKKAKIFVEYLTAKEQLLNERLGNIHKNKKPKILHLANFTPLKVDGTGTIINDWIEMAGGINAASDISGNMKDVSIEQVLQWNPDIIIIGGVVGSSVDYRKNIRNEVKDQIMHDKSWKQTSAVKNKKVVINPDGTFSWDRYSAEEALQIQWVAKILYPELFKDVDIIKETKWFYRTFFEYDLTDREVAQILNGEPPLY